MFFSQHDPFRPPDYRWQKIQWLLRHGRVVRGSREDRMVQVGRRFARALGKAATAWDRHKLAQAMPGIYFAHELYQHTEYNDRFVLEARILANEAPARIAERGRTTPEVVFWFEKLFFDVRPFLHQRDWIVNRVLGPAVAQGVREREYDVLLKLYALAGGPLAVDAMVEHMTPGRAWPRTAEELDAFWGQDQRDTMRRKAAIAARCLPINMTTHQSILEAHHRLLALEREERAGDDGTNLLVQNIGAALAALPFTVARPAGADPGQDPLERQLSAFYENSSAELRASELLALAVGGLPEDAVALQGRAFPVENPDSGPAASEKGGT